MTDWPYDDAPANEHLLAQGTEAHRAAEAMLEDKGMRVGPDGVAGRVFGPPGVDFPWRDRLAVETAFDNAAVWVKRELRRQDAKWGEQNHADGTGDQEHPLIDLAYYRSRDLFERMTAGSLAYRAKDATDRAAREGRVTWAAILLEEVFEALAEEDPEPLHTELVQVAAVALQWALAIERRTGAAS